MKEYTVIIQTEHGKIKYTTDVSPYAELENLERSGYWNEVDGEFFYTPYHAMTYISFLIENKQ